VQAEGRVREAREAAEHAIKELNKELHHDASEEHSPESVADELGRLAGVFLSISLEEEQAWDRFVQDNLQAVIDFSLENETIFTAKADQWKQEYKDGVNQF
jgi:hypothetical protein